MNIQGPKLQREKLEIKITTMNSSMGCLGHVFICWSVFIVAHMALLNNDNYIIFNHSDVYCSYMLGWSYFTIPDFLLFKHESELPSYFPLLLV